MKSLGLRDLKLKQEYRSDRDDIVSEFFFPCLSHCTQYDRCVDIISVKSLTTLAMGFENFATGKAKIRVVSSHRFKAADLTRLSKIFSSSSIKARNANLIKDAKIEYLDTLVKNNQIQLKVAIPNSESVAGSFSERIGIFADENNDVVAFTGTSSESFSIQTRNFESVDVFTSWDDKTRVETKRKDFEDLWNNITKYVEVYDFVYAEKNNMLKYSSSWAISI